MQRIPLPGSDLPPRNVTSWTDPTMARTTRSSANRRRTRSKSPPKRSCHQCLKGSYFLYINKILKLVHPDKTISSKTLDVVNTFINDIFDRLAIKASRLVRNKRHLTLQVWAIQEAVDLLLPGELAKYATAHGNKAIERYNSSKKTQPSSPAAS
ncbi:late histone H2B.L4-like [Tachyglossus aculeatus]|uniref:late histone H2B.L4-like n=1 Tax=Tachyglossus aculeatus TaxID=9261 RepID=UPI0018F712A2|nr:late histone H2B.L4-like [Tachyglossus aculeatus]